MLSTAHAQHTTASGILHDTIASFLSIGVFELTVMGKNGVTVNGVLHTPSSAPQQLYTQDFLQVGEQKFYFLLPKGVSR